LSCHIICALKCNFIVKVQERRRKVYRKECEKMKICIDAGHGGRKSGAVGSFITEKDINLRLSKMLGDRLSKAGINVVQTRKDDTYISLDERCRIANSSRCDYFISIHCNGFHDSQAYGTSTYHYKGSTKGMSLAKVIHKAAVGYNRNKDRGVQSAEFYVLKYTKMPAVLLECAFITNPGEEKMLNDGIWQEGFAAAVGNAVCTCFGMGKSDENPGGSAPPGGQGGEMPTGTSKHAITDIKHASIEQMESLVHKINPAAPYLAETYVRIGLQEGIRGDLAFAQAVLESDNFRYTGNVKPENNNPGGLKDAVFKNLEEGIRAHIQRLKAYANSEPLNIPSADPEFNLVERGAAPCIEDLNGRWAVPGDGYGENIVQIWTAILNEEINHDERR
jgi:N-acetylmuramoyl-L-alanine amidase